MKTLNANWVAGEDGGDGRFEVLLVTEDDQQHTIAPSPASMAALIALTQADTVLLWDPTNRDADRRQRRRQVAGDRARIGSSQAMVA